MRGGNYLCDGPVNADNLDAVMDRVISRGFEHRKQVISQASSRDLALVGRIYNIWTFDNLSQDDWSHKDWTYLVTRRMIIRYLVT